MTFETYAKRPANTTGRRPTQRPQASRPPNNRSSSTKTVGRNQPGRRPSGSIAPRPLNGVGAKPSVFNNFSRRPAQNRTNRQVFSSVGTNRPRGWDVGGKNIPGIDPHTPPVKTTQTDGPAIDNPGRNPGSDWGNQPGDCPCGNPSCKTLDRFVKGSYATTAAHDALLVQLADDIIRQNINVVTLTGHTDASGSDEYNMAMGIKRSLTVEKRLKVILHQRKPWSPMEVYFRTVSMGEKQPASSTDDGINRRVEVCLRRVNMQDKTILNS